MRRGIVRALTFVVLLVVAVTAIELLRFPGTFSGEGSAAAADQTGIAKVAVGFYAENELAGDAVKATAIGMRDIMVALRAAGVEDSDIAWTTVRSGEVKDRQQSWDGEGRNARFYSYQSLIVSVSDLGRVGTVLEGVSKAGANYWRVSYQDVGENGSTIDSVAHKVSLTEAQIKAGELPADSVVDQNGMENFSDRHSSLPDIGHRGSGPSAYMIGLIDNVAVTEPPMSLPMSLYGSRPRAN